MFEAVARFEATRGETAANVAIARKWSKARIFPIPALDATQMCNFLLLELAYTD